MLLQTLANNGDVTISGDVVSGTGHVSVLAQDDIIQNSDVITSGTVYFQANNATVDGAGTDGIIMASSADITTAGSGTGNVLLSAANEGDILLGQITKANANVSLIAQRSILDNNAGLTNVTAGNLRIQADSNSNNTGVVASQADAIETSVDILAAKSADGIYIQEANGVTVNNIAEIVVQQVNFNSTLSNVNIDDETLEDLSTTNNGAIKLQATLGNIEINAGAAGNPAISAQGTGMYCCKHWLLTVT